jgi:hypothetical protein
MKLDQDITHRIKTACLFLLESYKVVLGSFLTVFVPHDCPESDCSTLTLLARPHDVALGLNYGAFLTMMVLYAIELRREQFCITYFDVDPTSPDVHLASIIPPALKQGLLAHNQWYWKSAALAMAFAVANTVVSCVYLSTRAVDATTTTTFSFSLLVFMKLTRAYRLSREDAKEVRARSAYLVENTSYNILDGDLTDEPFDDVVCG